MSQTFLRGVLPLAVGIMLAGVTQTAAADDLLLFVSAFAKGDQGAIHAYRLNTQSGQLQQVSRTGEMQHPFFTALSPNRKYLYAIHAPEFGGKNNEEISAYEITGEQGELKLLNRQSALGTAACYLEVDATGKTVLVANYASGSVASLPVNPDGSLGEARTFVQHQGKSIDAAARQGGPHAHCIALSPDNKYAFAADLGLDKILAYQLNPQTSELTPSRQAFVRTLPGAGPRHLTFHPDGKQVYVINELQNSMSHFEYDAATGMLLEKETLSTLPTEFTGASYCADVKVTPNGKFLYGTNRGHDSIAIYALNEQGAMTLVNIEPSPGRGPQNLVVTPDGNWLLCANMPGNNVVVFRIDQQTGKLTKTGEPISIPSPSCIRIR